MVLISQASEVTMHSLVCQHRPSCLPIAGFDIDEVSRWFAEFVRTKYGVKVADDF